MMHRRRFAAALAAACALPRAFAQFEKPVRFILPVATGSGVDTIMRASSEALAKSLGHPVVIDNQPGAGGVIGTSAMIPDLMDGSVDVGVLSLPSIHGHLTSGMLRAIGTSSLHRFAAAPEIPSFGEQCLPNYILDGWFAAVGPKGLSAATVKQVHDA